MIRFIQEYNKWKREHRDEVQQAKLRREAMQTPLNYQILDKMFQIWTNGNNKDAVMEIKGKDFTVKFYWDEQGTFQRKTTTERIIEAYNRGE